MLSANQLFLLHTTGECSNEEADSVLNTKVFDIAHSKMSHAFPDATIARLTHNNDDVAVSGFHIYSKGRLEAYVVFNTSTSIKPKSIFKGALYSWLGDTANRDSVKVYSLFVNNEYTTENADIDFLKIEDITVAVKANESNVQSSLSKVASFYVGKVKKEQPIDVLPKPFSKKLKNFLSVFPTCELAKVPEHLLNDMQSRVRSVHVSGESYIDLQGLKSDLIMACDLTKPIFILDFESTQFLLPEYENIKPHAQMVFQYSLHKYHQHTLTHNEFIELKNDPRLALAQQLISDTEYEGVILAYNASFERRIIEGLAKLFPQLASQLLLIAERLYDLYPLFKAYFYHPSQKGKWSLKQVLPAVLGYDPYAELEGTNNGMEAAQIYHKAREGIVTFEQAYKQLSIYCTLDTFALYQLFIFVISDEKLVA